ncbi:MAG: LON peptidase substrate-binding domain-containing protein, partial [Spirochaetales bacterium]|nr:LON peptidase substrate-binding domain-containing protein [Spirochaetales bacterium]
MPDKLKNQQIIPVELLLPNKLFIIPLIGKPIFPGIFTPLIIESSHDLEVLDLALSGDNMIGLLLDKEDASEDDVATDTLYKIGTAAKIVKKINLPDGGVNIFISTLKRFRVKKFLSGKGPTVAAVEYLDDENDKSKEVKALTRFLLSEMKQLSENNPLFSEEMRLNMVNIDHPGKIADFITSILNTEREVQQNILETTDVQKRMEEVLVFIKKEQELLKIQKKIQQKINEKIEKSQRDYFLREELKAIKQELGMDVDSKTSEYNRLKEAIEKFNFEGEVKEQVDRELEKFSMMDPNISEYIVTRNYLDTIVSLPWNKAESKEIDLENSRKILDKDHYGLEDVKERILEYLA